MVTTDTKEFRRFYATHGIDVKWHYPKREVVTTKCQDCRFPRKLYSTFLLPDYVWEQIVPYENAKQGCLCASCVSARLSFIDAGEVYAAFKNDIDFNNG